MVSVSRLSRRRQAAGLHALPRPRKRYLRTREAFGVHLLAGAVEEQHCARRPTAPPVPSKPVPPPHLIPYSPEDIAQSRARFHPGPMERIRWRARFRPGQGTPWKPSLPLDERRVPVRFVPAPHSLAWPVSPQPKSHSGGKPPQSMRCRDPKRRLRTRAAFGVRLLAGAFRQRHCARAAPAPALLPTTDRILGGDARALVAAPGPHAGPNRNPGCALRETRGAGRCGSLPSSAPTQCRWFHPRPGDLPWMAEFHPGPAHTAPASWRTRCAAATPTAPPVLAKRVECAHLPPFVWRTQADLLVLCGRRERPKADRV